MNTPRVSPRRCSAIPPTRVAPFSAASARISSTWRGSSLIPGISGATSTPVGMPARLSSPTASRRARGLGVCGSLARHASRSIVGTERFALTGATAAISLSRSRSRSTSGDFVSTEHGLRVSRNAAQTSRISRYFDSTHW